MKDWNYVQWSVFGGSLTRPQVVADAKINNWTISFDLDAKDVQGTTNATFTVQLAGVETDAGNTDTCKSTAKYCNLPYVVNVNGQELEPWVIPLVLRSIVLPTADHRYRSYQSSGCVIRQAVTCYQTAHKFVFPTTFLTSNQTNEIVLSLPFNATNGINLSYDALRLEVQ